MPKLNDVVDVEKMEKDERERKKNFRWQRHEWAGSTLSPGVTFRDGIVQGNRRGGRGETGGFDFVKRSETT